MRMIDNWQTVVHDLNKRKGFYDYEQDVKLVENVLPEWKAAAQSMEELDYLKELEAFERILADYKRCLIERKLLLVIGEVCEAHEELRNGHNPKEIYFNEGEHKDKPEGFGIETADAHIRLFDLEKAVGLDTEYNMTIKHEYNETRSYKHGRSF